jgi:hypothetical protein
MRDTVSMLSGAMQPGKIFDEVIEDFLWDSGSPISSLVKEAGRDSCSGRSAKKADICATYERIEDRRKQTNSILEHMER